MTRTTFHLLLDLGLLAVGMFLAAWVLFQLPMAVNAFYEAKAPCPDWTQSWLDVLMPGDAVGCRVGVWGKR